MYHELYRDYGSVLDGGLWTDPESGDTVEVIDLDSACGIAGATLVERGAVYVCEDYIRKGAMCRSENRALVDSMARITTWVEQTGKFARLGKKVSACI